MQVTSEHISTYFSKVRFFDSHLLVLNHSFRSLCGAAALLWPAMKRSFSTANLQASAPEMPESKPKSESEPESPDKDRSFTSSFSPGSTQHPSDAETLDLSTGLPFSQVGLRPAEEQIDPDADPVAAFYFSSGAETEDVGAAVETSANDVASAAAVISEFLQESGVDEFAGDDANENGSELTSLDHPGVEAQASKTSQEVLEHDLLPDMAFTAACQIGLNILPLDPDDASNLPVRSWRDPLRQILDLETAQWKRPLQLGTLCSGLGTPHLALVELGIPVNEVFAADPKPCCSKVAANANIQPDHYFHDAACILDGSGWCRVHSTTCEVPLLSLDLCVAGFPCSPFSTQRACRFKRPWHSHPEAPVMKTVCQGIRKEQPRLALLENVVGFLREPRHCEPKCYFASQVFYRALNTGSIELFLCLVYPLTFSIYAFVHYALCYQPLCIS